MKKVLLVLIGSFMVFNVSVASPKAVSNESLLKLIQAKMSEVLSNVRVTSESSNPMSICGGEEKVFYMLNIEVMNYVRTGVSTFEKSWDTVKTYYVEADQIDGKDIKQLEDVILFDPATCIE